MRGSGREISGWLMENISGIYFYVQTNQPSNDLHSVKVFLHSSQTQFVHVGGGRGIVCESSTQLKRQKNPNILIVLDVPFMIRAHDSFKITKRKFTNLAEMDKKL